MRNKRLRGAESLFVEPRRPRQFRFFLSHREWEKLVDLADAEDVSASEVVRALIHRRHEEVFRAEGPDWLAAAEELSALSRRLRSLAEKRSTGRDGQPPGKVARK
jgi:hypothetical protein